MLVASEESGYKKGDKVVVDIDRLGEPFKFGNIEGRYFLNSSLAIYGKVEENE